MKKVSILSELKTQCPPLLQEYGKKGGEVEKLVTSQKIGHIRADYDGYRWWNSIWICNKELVTPQVSKEIDLMYERLTANNAFRDFVALRAFCRQHPEAAVNGSKDEYNFYFEGVFCTYWLRCITRIGDYNLYLHAFAKEDPHG